MVTAISLNDAVHGRIFSLEELESRASGVPGFFDLPCDERAKLFQLALTITSLWIYPKAKGECQSVVQNIEDIGNSPEREYREAGVAFLGHIISLLEEKGV